MKKESLELSKEGNRKQAVKTSLSLIIKISSIIYLTYSSFSAHIGVSLAQQMFHRALLLVYLIVTPHGIEPGYFK